MLSDEEKKALNSIKRKFECEQTRDNYKILIGLYKNVEIEILLNLFEKQSKEIEELKEERKSYTEKYIHDNPWLYKQLNEVYMLRTEAEQKERKAYRKGTNDAYELCNKMWKDKIKAKVKEISKEWAEGELDGEWYEFMKYHLESLLGKE